MAALNRVSACNKYLLSPSHIMNAIIALIWDLRLGLALCRFRELCIVHSVVLQLSAWYFHWINFAIPLRDFTFLQFRFAILIKNHEGLVFLKLFGTKSSKTLCFWSFLAQSHQKPCVFEAFWHKVIKNLMFFSFLAQSHQKPCVFKAFWHERGTGACHWGNPKVRDWVTAL